MESGICIDQFNKIIKKIEKGKEPVMAEEFESIAKNEGFFSQEGLESLSENYFPYPEKYYSYLDLAIQSPKFFFESVFDDYEIELKEEPRNHNTSYNTSYNFEIKKNKESPMINNFTFVYTGTHFYIIVRENGKEIIFDSERIHNQSNNLCLYHSLESLFCIHYLLENGIVENAEEALNFINEAWEENELYSKEYSEENIEIRKLIARLQYLNILRAIIISSISSGKVQSNENIGKMCTLLEKLEIFEKEKMDLLKSVSPLLSAVTAKTVKKQKNFSKTKPKSVESPILHKSSFVTQKPKANFIPKAAIPPKNSPMENILKLALDFCTNDCNERKIKEITDQVNEIIKENSEIRKNTLVKDFLEVLGNCTGNKKDEKAYIGSLIGNYLSNEDKTPTCIQDLIKLLNEKKIEDFCEKFSSNDKINELINDGRIDEDKIDQYVSNLFSENNEKYIKKFIKMLNDCDKEIEEIEEISCSCCRIL